MEELNLDSSLLEDLQTTSQLHFNSPSLGTVFEGNPPPPPPPPPSSSLQDPPLPSTSSLEPLITTLSPFAVPGTQGEVVPDETNIAEVQLSFSGNLLPCFEEPPNTVPPYVPEGGNTSVKALQQGGSSFHPVDSLSLEELLEDSSGSSLALVPPFASFDELPQEDSFSDMSVFLNFTPSPSPSSSPSSSPFPGSPSPFLDPLPLFLEQPGKQQKSPKVPPKGKAYPGKGRKRKEPSQKKRSQGREGEQRRWHKILHWRGCSTRRS